MAFRWAQNLVRPGGVDFGADGLKLLQVAEGDPPELIAAASEPVPAEMRGDLTARLDYYADALRRLLREGQFKGRRAVLSIPAAQTFVQHVRVAKSDQIPLDDQVTAELQRQLGVDPACLVVRHVPVGDVFSGSTARHEAICLVAARRMVMQHVEAAQRAGLNVVGMCCEPLAIMEAFAHRFRRAGDENRVTLLLDIGRGTTKVIIAHGRSIVFAKIIDVAGSQLSGDPDASSAAPSDAAPEPSADTTALTDATPLVIEPAHDPEAVAVLDSAQQSPANQSQISTAPTPATQPSGAEMLDSLVEELQLCIGYHASVFSDRPVESAIFLGGEARRTDQCQVIAQALQLPSQVADPLARLGRHAEYRPPVGVDLRSPQPGWAVPLGLCLSRTNL